MLSIVLAAAESVCAETAQQSTKDDAAHTIISVPAGVVRRPAGAAAPASNLAIGPFQLVRAPDLPPNTCPAAPPNRRISLRPAPSSRRRLPTSFTPAPASPVSGTGQRDRRGRAELRHSAELLECRFRRQLELLRSPGQGAATANGGSQYGKGVVRAIRSRREAHFAAGFAVSPNYSNTGAWSEYTAAGLGYELPRSALRKLGAVVSGGAGYFVFGNQSAAIGGFPLPAYLTWNLGVTVERGDLHFDLRYFDANLSKANCFVLTGDPNATLGGHVDPLSNPRGLESNRCSATLVAKFWFALN